MAHTCCECGQACYCNDDIDDCFLEETEAAKDCHHCPDLCGSDCNCAFKDEESYEGEGK